MNKEQKEFKNLIKKQDKIITEEIYRNMDSFLVEAGKRSIEQLNQDRHLFVENIFEVILKVRKETTEYVCDKMIGEKLKESIDEEYNTGYNVRIEKENKIKKQILKDYNLNVGEDGKDYPLT